MNYKVIKPKVIDIKSLTEAISENSKYNIILDVLEISISEKEIKELYNFHTKNNTNGTSFVVINKEISLDNLPDGLNVVPTFQEATDLIDLEEMMRDLG